MASASDLLSSPFMLRATSTHNVNIEQTTLKYLEEEKEYANGWCGSSNVLLNDRYKLLKTEMINCDQHMRYYKIISIVIISLTILFTAVSNVVQMTAVDRFPQAIYLSVAVNCLSIVALSIGKTVNAEKKVSQLAMQTQLLNKLRTEIKLILHTKSSNRDEQQATLKRIINEEAKIFEITKN